MFDLYDKTYNKITRIFDNKDTSSWEKWLEFDKNFSKQGKQGVSGIMKTKMNESHSENDQESYSENDQESYSENSDKVVFKFSRYINYLPVHEYIITKSLGEIYNYCPFFCRTYSLDNITIDSHFRDKPNPFIIESKYPIDNIVHWMEYVEGKKLSHYIRSPNINDEIIFSIIKQVLLAILIAQKKKRFVHYDLHSNNIIIRKIDPNIVFLFVIDENTQFIVPSYGYCPIIIDYGYSYCKDLEDKTFWNTLAFTDVGFLTDRFDNIADPKLFTVTISSEFKDHRKSKLTKKFKNIVKNTYGDLKIEMDSGWDTIEKVSASNTVLDKLGNTLNISSTFEEYGHYCIDLIQSLIILPLEKQDYKDIKENFKIFLREFNKIENKIGSRYYNIYILKKIIDVVRELREYYIGVNEKVEIVLPTGEVTSDLHTIRKYSLSIFTTEVKKIITSVSKYYNPTDIHYEKMLCSLILLSKNTEGMLFDIMKKLMVKKEKDYKKVPLKQVEELIYIIDYNIPTDVVLTENTNICVLDSLNEISYMEKIPKNKLKKLNKKHNLDVSKKLYSYLINKNG